MDGGSPAHIINASGPGFNSQCRHVRQKFHPSHKCHSPHYRGPCLSIRPYVGESDVKLSHPSHCPSPSTPCPSVTLPMYKSGPQLHCIHARIGKLSLMTFVCLSTKRDQTMLWCNKAWSIVSIVLLAPRTMLVWQQMNIKIPLDPGSLSVRWR